ncbi:MAG: hypothetical protein ACJ8M1_12865 [Chthoniobacterales bacterium]
MAAKNTILLRAASRLNFQNLVGAARLTERTSLSRPTFLCPAAQTPGSSQVVGRDKLVAPVIGKAEYDIGMVEDICAGVTRA